MMVWYLGSELFTMGAPGMARVLVATWGSEWTIASYCCPSPATTWLVWKFNAGSIPRWLVESEDPPRLPPIRGCSCSIDTRILNQQDLSSKHGPVPLSL